jgi:hypothetical protein
VDDVFADPLGPASGLALVDGDAEVDVARLVVSHLPGKGGPGLKILILILPEYPNNSCELLKD